MMVTIARLRVRVPRDVIIDGERVLVGWRHRRAIDILREDQARQDADDLQLGRCIREKNQAAAVRGGGGRREKTGAEDHTIRVERAKYRKRHPYDRGQYSTSAMARHLARTLKINIHTLRRRLGALGLR